MVMLLLKTAKPGLKMFTSPNSLKLTGKVKESGYTLIPLKLYFKDGRAKVEIALARGKKDYDKRQALKEKQDKREAEKAMKSRGKEW
jgi:SsrA-binding protein